MKFPPFEFGIVIRISKGVHTCFGPGVRELLQLTHQTGSLRAASIQMKMSYSKAFNLIKKSESLLGFPLLTRQIGGVGGGYSRLTERAHWILDQYIKMEQETMLFLKAYLDEHFAEPSDRHTDEQTQK